MLLGCLRFYAVGGAASGVAGGRVGKQAAGKQASRRQAGERRTSRLQSQASSESHRVRHGATAWIPSENGSGVRLSQQYAQGLPVGQKLDSGLPTRDVGYGPGNGLEDALS